MNTKKSIILLFIVCSCIQLSGQGRTIPDSLCNVLRKTTSDTARINLYLDIGYYYEAIDLETALKYYDSAQVFSQKLLPDFTPGKIKEYLAGHSQLKNNKQFRSNLLLLSRSVRYKGIVHYFQSNLPLSLENYQNSLIISEFLNNETDIAKCYTNIGLIQQSMDNQPLALEYYTKSLEINRKMNDETGMLNSLNQIGSINIKLKDYSKALKYCEEALKISEQLNNRIERSVCLSNMGTIYKHFENYKKALEIYQQALVVDMELNDSLNISISLNQIGNIFRLTGNNSKAIEYSQKSLLIAQNIGFKESIKYASQNLIECYSRLNNYKKCFEYFNIYNAIKDSIYNEQSRRQLHEMETIYQTEKKQLQIEKLNKEKELQQSEILRQEEKGRQQKLIIIFIIAGFVMITVFAVFVVQRLRITRRQNEEIKAQRDEIEVQRDHIKEIHNSITDSITYAKRIQTALLPDLSLLFGNQLSVISHQSSVKEDVDNSTTPLITDHRSLITDYFVLFKPKDIVSGDFYWATKINEYLILCVADCTGHGVPGAFMSMLGVSFLNEIVRKKEVTKASDVLNHLRESIIESLQQRDGSRKNIEDTSTAIMGVNDGMDIAVCVINTETLMLQYSGANNPLYIVGSRQSAVGSLENNCGLQTADCRLIELKADKQPVAIYIKMSLFTDKEIQLNKGDCLYLASDGYEDQFGGPKNTKFMAKQLKGLLTGIACKPMKEQHDILNDAFEKWKGNEEQIDDVTIMGLRI